MGNLLLDENFMKSISFLDNILLVDSVIDEIKKYNMTVDYLKVNNHYILKLNILDGQNELLNTECTLANKFNGSVVIKNIIDMITNKYNKDLIVDVKELDDKNNCIKFGRRTYNRRK